MNIRIKYLITSVVVVAGLVSAVSVARSFNRPSSTGTDQAKSRGLADAPIEMVEYSDFQCPACRVAREPIEKLRSQFPDQIRFQFRHYPLERSHRWALAAAQFAECAAEQDKFWPYHDRLYDEQPNWANAPNALELFAKFAQEIGLDFEALRVCASSTEVLNRIRNERSEGERRGVQSTPTMFINGKPVVGSAQLEANGAQLIRDALQKK